MVRAIDSRAGSKRLGALSSAIVVGLVVAGGCAAHRPVPQSTFSWPDGDPQAGKDAFVRVGCAACHEVRGVDGIPAPTVDPPVPVIFGGRSPSRPTPERLVECIVNPDVHISLSHRRDEVQIGDQSRMSDFTRALTVRELIDIVAFLLAVHDGENVD